MDEGYNIVETLRKEDESGKLSKSDKKINSNDDVKNKIFNEKNLLNDVFNSITDGISILSTDLNIIKINSYMENLYGHKSPIIGKKCYNIYQDRKKICPWCPSLKAIETKRVSTSTVPFPNEKNPEKWLLLSCFPLIDNNNNVYGVIEYVKDVTIQKKIELELKNALENLQNIINASPSSIITVDAEGKIKNWNPASEKLFGWKKEEVINKFNPTIPDNQKEIYLKTIKERHINLKIKVVNRDNNPIDINISTTPLFDNKDSFVGALGIMTDISKQKQSEDRFRTISEVTTDLIYEWDVKTDKLRWFGNIESELGFKKGEFSHDIKNWIKLIHPDDIKNMHNSVEKHRTMTTPIFEVYRMKRKDGSYRYWEDRANPILDVDGKPLRWIGGCKDITNQKLLEHELKSKIEKLERYKKVTVGRELRIKSLKEKISELERIINEKKKKKPKK